MIPTSRTVFNSSDTLCAKIIGVDPDIMTAELEFEGTERLTNPVGDIQGGFLAAMLDEAMGTAVGSTLDAGEFPPTINLNVQFHRRAKTGTIAGIGRVVKKGSQICHLSGELYQSRELIASATASALIKRHGDAGR